MKYLVEKDRKRRNLFKKREVKRRFLKAMKRNEFLPLSVRLLASGDLHKDKGREVSIHNFCTVSGRPRGVLRDFKVSRMVFKEMANSGYLFGIRKSSW